MITILLIAVNVAVFIAIQKGKLDTYRLGASYDMVFGYKRYIRIITSAFTQEAPLHLLCNMFSLYNIGQFVEDWYGSFLYLIIYFAIIIVGGSASLISKHNAGRDNVISIGASGAICGLIGIYVGKIFRYFGFSAISSLIPSLLPMIVMTFMPGIDKSGHLYGFLTGAIIGLLF